MSDVKDALAECILLNRTINKIPFKLDYLKRSDPRKAAEIEYQLRTIGEVIDKGLRDPKANEEDIRRLNQFKTTFQSRLRMLK